LIFLVPYAVFVALLFLTAPLAAQNQRYVFLSTASGTGSGGTIQAWRVDLINGTFTFTPAPGSPFNEGLDPVAIAVHPSGKFLFVANQNQRLSDVSVYTIDPTSTTSLLTRLPASPFSTGLSTHPVGIIVEPAGKYLYVVNTDGQSNGPLPGPPANPFYGSIDSYSIDQTTGALAPTSTPYVNLPASPIAANPAMADPTGNYLYVVGHDGTSSSQTVTFQIDPLTGNLSSGFRLSEGSVNRCAAIDPLGRYIFICSGDLQGHIELHNIQQGFPTDAGDIFGGQSTFQDFPAGLTVDETGSYLYAFFTMSHLRGFSIGSGGSLTELAGSPFGGPSSPLTADLTGPILYGSGLPSQIAMNGTLTPLFGLTLQLMQGVTALATLGPPSGQPVTGPVAVLPAFLDFASTNVGTTGVGNINLSNTGRATLLISNRVISGPNAADFVVQSDNCLPALSPNGSCQFVVAFTPRAIGARQATLTITDNASGSPHSVVLNGSGAATAPAITLPSRVTFPDTSQDGTSPPQDIAVTSSGTAPLHIDSVTLGGVNSADFKVTADSCTGIDILVNQKCTISVTFTPAAQGARTASIAIANNASNSTVTLVGNSKPAFTISGSTTAAPVAAGHAVQYPLQVTPSPDFSGGVTGSCTGSPTGATCTVGPIAQLNGASGIPVSFVVNVSTTQRSVLAPLTRWPSLDPHGLRRPLVPSGLWLLAVGVFLTAVWASEPNIRAATRGAQHLAIRFALTAVLFCVFTTLAACGSGGEPGSPSPLLAAGTPAGTYTVTLTLTASNGATAKQLLTLIVQ
jgi:6-phosphogluconolactonase (cycloisomerase 2 family)